VASGRFDPRHQFLKTCSLDQQVIFRWNRGDQKPPLPVVSVRRGQFVLQPCCVRHVLSEIMAPVPV